MVCVTVDSSGNSELMNNGFASDKEYHVRGVKLLLHRNEEQLQGLGWNRGAGFNADSGTATCAHQC